MCYGHFRISWKFFLHPKTKFTNIFFFKVKLALKQSLFKKQTFLQCSTKAQKFDTCMQEMTVGKYEVRKLHIQCELCNS